jgi:hypothetical protein
LAEGVEAFKNGQYDEAGRLFRRAKEFDPSLVNARLYLATTLVAQYIPGAPSADNRQLGRRAVEEFPGVLQIDRGNMSAIDGMASPLFPMAGTAPVDLE